jgi:hypothetical protein
MKDIIKEYGEWYLDNYPDEISNKDDLIEKYCKGIRFEEFKKEKNKSIAA